MTRMSATVRELVDEAYDRRESTWRAALETVNDWVESVRAPSALLSGDRVRVVDGRIKDRLRTGEKLRRKLADANDEIHESVEVENQVIDVVGSRVICRTEREQSALWDLLTEVSDDTNLSIAEVRDYSAIPKPSGTAAVTSSSRSPSIPSPPSSSSSNCARSCRTRGVCWPRNTCSNPGRR